MINFSFNIEAEASYCSGEISEIELFFVMACGELVPFSDEQYKMVTDDMWDEIKEYVLEKRDIEWYENKIAYWELINDK